MNDQGGDYRRIVVNGHIFRIMPVNGKNVIFIEKSAITDGTAVILKYSETDGPVAFGLVEKPNE